MVGTRVRITSEVAPCGRLVDGEYYREGDDEGLVIDNHFYACGCHRALQEYHDGSIHTRVTRHDGKIVVDDYSPERGA